jgi:hypothetical protein
LISGLLNLLSSLISDTKEDLKQKYELHSSVSFERYEFYDVHQIERLLDADILQDFLFNSSFDSEESQTNEQMLSHLEKSIMNVLESTLSSPEGKGFFELHKSQLLNELIEIRAVSDLYLILNLFFYLE